MVAGVVVPGQQIAVRIVIMYLLLGGQLTWVHVDLNESCRCNQLIAVAVATGELTLYSMLRVSRAAG